MFTRALFAVVVLAVVFNSPVSAGEWATVTEKPKADQTGLIPGDVVMGNLARFPGHAGIYIGKWRDLPPELRRRYERLHDEEFATVSGNPGLADTYLVIDSYSPGVRIRSMAEQFTSYFSRGEVDSAGALTWEAEHGNAIGYLPDDDMRRWRVVEEALRMAKAKVRFPSYPRRISATFIENYRQKATEDAHLNDPYGKHEMDCISMAYVAYWRGAGMKLEIAGEKSLLNWYLKVVGDPRFSDVGEVTMTSPMIKSMLSTLSGQRRDNVDFRPVYIEAAMLGPWSGTTRVTVGGETASVPLALMNLPHRSGEADEKVKEFETYALDPKKFVAMHGDPLISIAELKRDGRIVASGTKLESRWEYILDPKTESLHVDTTIYSGGEPVSTRGRLRRGTGNIHGYDVKVELRPSWRRGPMRATVYIVLKGGDADTSAPALIPAPYLVVAELGARRQYLYPRNAVYPDVKVERGRPLGYTRFTELHIPAPQAMTLAETLTVSAILPDGQRLRKTVRVPYLEEDLPNHIQSSLKKRDANLAKMKAALALPATDRRRASKVAGYCANVLRMTMDRREAGALWRTAKQAVAGSGKPFDILQRGHFDGAVRRGDVALCRTLVSERLRAGTATTGELLTLVEALVRYNNDVKAARTYWQEFIAAVGRMDSAAVKRARLDQTARSTLLLPEKAIKP